MYVCMFVEEVEGILNAINEFTRGASCINVHKIWMNYGILEIGGLHLLLCLMLCDRLIDVKVEVIELKLPLLIH